jgi:DNA-binding transcriptional LysR family regulator
MTMELRHIRYFLAVAEERHFTRAAAKIGIGQPPLSQQIKDLEAEIGAPLFHRVAHGAELTSAGEAFLQAVKEMPTLAERATKAARRAARGETGSLRLGYTPSATFNAAVPSAILAFRRAYPEVDLTLEEANTTPLVTGLREGTLDAVFVRPGTPDTEKLQLRRVAEEPVVIALAKRHPVAALEKIDLARLENDPFLLFSREIAPGLYDTVVNACRKAGCRARRIDRPGVDDASARDGHRVSTDCRPVADDSACSGLPARRDVARGA